MKKILLIPSLLTITTAPLVTLVSCNNGGNPEPKPEDHAFETCTFEYLNKNCSDLENGTITQEEFLNAFTLEGQPVTDMDQFIGKTKRVQLKHQDLDHDNDPNDYLNGNEVAQTIRVIGTCADDDTKYQVNVIDNQNTKATFTFEFADLISDANGYSLATTWMNDPSITSPNNDYLNSTIRKNISGLGDGKNAHWYQINGATFTTDTNYEGKTVVQMLPDALASSLKSPKNRTINIKNVTWSEQPIEDSLFLLSAIEIEPSWPEERELEMKGYRYYSDDGDKDPNRIKRQIKKDEGARDECIEITDIEYNQCYSYAGYDKVVEEETLEPMIWLSSPYIPSINGVHSIDEYGFVANGNDARDYATAIAPGFCI